MIQLAFDLGMQTAQPSTWTALQSDCCTASGITCDGSQRVTEIQWYFLGLNGVINGTAIPSSVTHLVLRNNGITGPIPSALPSGLREMYLHGNQMSGDLPSFPSTLQYLFLGYSGNPGNHFTGSLRLNRPLWLRINDNWIADVVIQDSSQINPSWCDLSNNPLLGNPNIAELTMCTQNDLYSSALLPITRSTIELAKATSITETTTQLASSEMITTTLESTNSVTTMADGATKMETTSKFGRTSAQQTLSSVPQAFFWTSTAGTVLFVQEMNGFDVNLDMMLRIVIGAMLLTYVMTRTPFVREFKKMRNKGTRGTTTSVLEF